MSKTAPGATDEQELTDGELRERTEKVVVSRTRKGRVLHLPDDQSEKATPLCGTADRDRGWIRKDTACYPPGNREFCRRCAERLREQEEAKESSVPTWLLVGDVEAGDALQSEWG
jgi:hypothetical protein